MTNQKEKKIADARPPPNTIKKRLDAANFVIDSMRVSRGRKIKGYYNHTL